MTNKKIIAMQILITKKTIRMLTGIRTMTNKIRRNRKEFYEKRKLEIVSALQPCTKRQLELLSEKGASSWLTSLPLKEYGFLLNKQEFHDSLALRYNLVLSTLDRPKHCRCGQANTANHLEDLLH